MLHRIKFLNIKNNKCDLPSIKLYLDKEFSYTTSDYKLNIPTIGKFDINANKILLKKDNYFSIIFKTNINIIETNILNLPKKNQKDIFFSYINNYLFISLPKDNPYLSFIIIECNINLCNLCIYTTTNNSEINYTLEELYIDPLIYKQLTYNL